jgi:hypothetical protein
MSSHQKARAGDVRLVCRGDLDLLSSRALLVHPSPEVRRVAEMAGLLAGLGFS